MRQGGVLLHGERRFLQRRACRWPDFQSLYKVFAKYSGESQLWGMRSAGEPSLQCEGKCRSVGKQLEGHCGSDSYPGCVGGWDVSEQLAICTLWAPVVTPTRLWDTLEEHLAQVLAVVKPSVSNCPSLMWVLYWVLTAARNKSPQIYS